MNQEQQILNYLREGNAVTPLTRSLAPSQRKQNQRRRKMNQQERILDYLQQGNTLNRLDSWDKLGVIEAPARISELRGKGHKIRTRMKPVVNRYGEKVSVAEWRLSDEY